MRKTFLFIGITIGAAVGLFATLPDSVSVKIVMMALGALPGAAIGGAISGMNSKRSRKIRPQDSIPGTGFSSEERLDNYWRDKGKIYPASGHPDPEGAMRDPNHRL